MRKRVKVGKYHTVFRGVVFKVKQAKAVFPSGEVKVFERAVRPPTVTILAIDSRGRLLLTREYRLKHKKYLWRLPSGRVDKEKDPLRAAQRELREETGFKAKKLKLFHANKPGNALDWKMYYYIATGLTPAPLEGDEDEDIKVVPTPISRAFKMVTTGEINNENIAFIIMKLYYSRRR